MFGIMGFGRSAQTPGETGSASEKTPAAQPVKSLVRVRFPSRGCCYAYYNDRFDLHEGDLVFVSGQMAGVCGAVESVTYKFKINLKQYQRIVAQPNVCFSGSYMPVLKMMVSLDRDAVSPDLFRTWVKAPFADDDENKPDYVTGEGYSLDLESFEKDEDAEEIILSRAEDYCEERRVRYISVRDGVGTAFVEGTTWYELNFRFENGRVSELYCECPYPGLCKHSLAVLITLRALIRKLGAVDFTAFDRKYFYRMLHFSGQSITVQPKACN